MGRIAVTVALLVALVACSQPVAGRPAPEELPIPEAEQGGTSGSSAAEDDAPATAPRGAAATVPRAASSAQRGFPFGEAQAEWIAATPWNYDRGRFGERVQYIVIHYTAISYERTLRAFRSPASGVSAHYVVRHDGHVTQMVSEDDTAWQAGNYWYNLRSVGIEIELAPGESNAAFTPEQYYATAALACGISARHGVPLDRVHVVGHNEIPGTGKIDPGPTWGWPHFMYLTSLCAPPSQAGLRAGFVSQSHWPEVELGEEGLYQVKLLNAGTVAWRKGGSTEVRLGLVGASRDPVLVGHGWPMPDRPAVQEEAIVPPGQMATFSIPVRGGAAGEHLLRFRPVVDGATWLPDLGLHAVVKVTPKGLGD